MGRKKNSAETHFQNGLHSVSRFLMITPTTHNSDPEMYQNPETYTVSMSPVSHKGEVIGFSVGPDPFASLDPCRRLVEWKNPKGLQLWYCRQARPLLLPAGAGVWQYTCAQECIPPGGTGGSGHGEGFA